MFAIEITLLHAQKNGKNVNFQALICHKLEKAWNASRHAVDLSNLYWKASPLQVLKDKPSTKNVCHENCVATRTKNGKNVNFLSVDLP